MCKRAQMSLEWLKSLSPDQHVLIAGPTASGKSALALQVAQDQGGVIVNADALQVYDNWHVLTARPAATDLARAPHALYGHITRDQPYSVGHWLREVADLLADNRLIITGGTGLYFTALTQGLADIPPVPAEIRALADQHIATDNGAAMLADLDPTTRARIDVQNPVRIQRAWEVQRATGRGLAAWQDDTPAPLLPLQNAQPLVLNADRDWLAGRIAQRFDLMIQGGALDEARANLANWDPTKPSSRALGAPELIAHLRGEISREAAKHAAIVATRQYAKRQRTWFRSKMGDWPSKILP